MQLCKQETTQDWEISCDKHVGRIIQGGFNIYQKSVTEAPPVNLCGNCHKVIRCYEILVNVPNCLLDTSVWPLHSIFESVALWFVVSIGFNLNFSISTTKRI